MTTTPCPLPVGRQAWLEVDEPSPGAADRPWRISFAARPRSAAADR